MIALLIGVVQWLFWLQPLPAYRETERNSCMTMTMFEYSLYTLKIFEV